MHSKSSKQVKGLQGNLDRTCHETGESCQPGVGYRNRHNPRDEPSAIVRIESRFSMGYAAAVGKDHSPSVLLGHDYLLHVLECCQERRVFLGTHRLSKRLGIHNAAALYLPPLHEVQCGGLFDWE